MNVVFIGTPEFAVPSLEFFSRNSFVSPRSSPLPTSRAGAAAGLVHARERMRPETFPPSAAAGIAAQPGLYLGALSFPPRSFYHRGISDPAFGSIFDSGEGRFQPACVSSPEVSRGGSHQLGYHQRRKRIGRHDIFPPREGRHGEHHPLGTGGNSGVDDCRRFV